MNSGNDDDAPVTGAAGPSDDASHRADDAVEATPRLPAEELSGQADLDEALAKPVFDGSTGIEAAQVWIGAFLILVAALLAYSNALAIPFQYPDRQAIVDNVGAQSIPMAPAAAKASGNALLPMVTVALTWLVSSGSPGVLHGLSAALHALNGVLVYLLARRLLRINVPRAADSGGPDLSEPIAMLGGFLMALHPLATESVNLVIGRAPLLCTMFSLMAILLFLRAADREEGTNVGALIGAGVSFALAWACDVTALIVPLFMLMADWIANGGSMIRRLPVHAAFWGTGIAFAVAAISVAGLETNPYAVFDPQVMVAPPVKAAAYNTGMSLGVNPINLSIEHDLPPASGYLDPELSSANPIVTAFTAGGLGLVALILVAARSAGGLGLFWFLSALVPAAFFVPPYGHFSERALYFSLCGIAMMLPWAVSKAALNKTTARVAGLASVALLLAAAAGTYLRNGVWQSEDALWIDASQKAPDAPGPFIRLGTIHHDIAQQAVFESEQLLHDNQRPAALKKREEAMNEFSTALNYLQSAVSAKPDDAALRRTLGVVFQFLDRRNDAIEMLTESLRLDPSSQDTVVQLASLYGANPADPANADGKLRALDYYARAARLGSLPLPAAMNYGGMLARMGNVMGAVEVVAPLAQTADKDSPIQRVMQQLTGMLQSMGDDEKQARAAEQANPDSPEAVKLRVRALLASGQLLPAFYRLDTYLQKNPGDIEAWLFMGTTCAHMGIPATFLKEYPSAPAAKDGEPSAWMQLVRRSAEQGRWSAARAYVEYGATQTDTLSKPLLRLGQLAIELKQPAVGATVLEEAAKADPTDPAPWLTLCDIAIASDNMPQARHYLDEAERLGADPAAMAARREKTGTTPESEKVKPRTVLQ